MRERSMKKRLVTLMVMAVAMANAAWAGTNIGLRGIGGRAGFVFPDGGDGTITLGAVADMGTWTDNLPWEFALTWWNSGEERRYFGDKYDFSITDIALRSTIAYQFELDKGLYLYPGAGLGVHFISLNHDYPGGYDDSDTELSLIILGGLQFPISGKWHGQTELQFDLGDAEQTNLQIDFIYSLGK